MLHSQHCEVM